MRISILGLDISLTIAQKTQDEVNWYPGAEHATAQALMNQTRLRAERLRLFIQG